MTIKPIDAHLRESAIGAIIFGSHARLEV
jgi:hypothetical protein